MNKLTPPLPILQTAGLTLIRLFTGFFMIYHGWEIFEPKDMNKYLEWDMFKTDYGKTLVYLGKGAELVGGLLLSIGLFTRIAAITLVGTMAYITFIIGNSEVWQDAQHPFLFVLLGLVFVFLGGGLWSFDHFLFKNKKR